MRRLPWRTISIRGRAASIGDDVGVSPEVGATERTETSSSSPAASRPSPLAGRRGVDELRTAHARRVSRDAAPIPEGQQAFRRATLEIAGRFRRVAVCQKA